MAGTEGVRAQGQRERSVGKVEGWVPHCDMIGDKNESGQAHS